MTPRRALRALAAHTGILPRYVDNTGVIRRTSDSTYVALLAALGIDAASEPRARRALGELREAAARRLLAPARTLCGVARSLRVVLPAGYRRGRLRWELAIRDETGGTRRLEGHARGGGREIRARLDPVLAPGYHSLRLALRDQRGVEAEETQTLIVAPKRCPSTADLLDGARVYGLLANLYTVRSRRNWGAGNLGDLGALVRWAREIGAAFVGVNPLHATHDTGGAISPYSPVSRLYRNTLYLDVAAVPELRECPAAQRHIASRAVQAEIAALRAAPHVQYERLATLTRPLLETLHRTFAARHRDRDSTRGRAYRRYLEAEGETLADFATFLALVEYFAGARRQAHDWRTWPAPYRDPRSPAVVRFREAHRERIDLHCYLQFELDRQLADAAGHAREDRLPLGIYQDLALGSAPGGSDTWAFPGLFVQAASLGAPPDSLGPTGQNWGLPPMDPRALAGDGYRFWVRLVRAAFRHAGALRIDHAMGLLRQFWIPQGGSGADGAYVRFPAADLLAILALESTRAGALVIGEDLGTVPPGFSRLLARWRILSTRVLYFERDARGAFRPSRRYPARALVAANTHDTAPLAGFWQGRDLELRRATDQIPSDAALARAQRERARERRALLDRLVVERVLPARKQPAAAELTAAVHAFLARTPAALVGVSLDDLAGEVDPVNLPGVDLDRYPSWQRRLGRTLEELRRDPTVLGTLPARRVRMAPGALRPPRRSR